MLEPCPPCAVWDFSGAEVSSAGLPSPSLSLLPAYPCLHLREGQAEDGRERTKEPHWCLFIALMKM